MKDEYERASPHAKHLEGISLRPDRPPRWWRRSKLPLEEVVRQLTYECMYLHGLIESALSTIAELGQEQHRAMHKDATDKELKEFRLELILTMKEYAVGSVYDDTLLIREKNPAFAGGSVARLELTDNGLLILEERKRLREEWDRQDADGA